jgi:signal-transduction protein with cAMP-binding, CBS, and nucleotidyltransferase domain
VTMGPFGELEDEHRRELAAELAVRCLKPGEIWLEDGAPVPAIALVGAGDIELYGPISEETSETIEPGGLVFPELVLVGGEAPSSARAGAQGALLLIAPIDAAKRIAAGVPDLTRRLLGF